MLATLLTPPGRGALAVLHVTGVGARTLVASLLARDLSERPRPGALSFRGEILDEVVARLAPGFTGEETVEITSHGSPAVVERILRALEENGARRADAAELLERGVETGHLDRLRAEAWSLLPRAVTELAARVLHDQAEGALSRAVAALSGPAGAERLLATAPLGIALASPPRVVLAGAPNVGKSTLFNALLEKDRVIVSPEPGTTRDPVRETVAIDQVPIELVDTAGVEAPRDLLEQLSIDRTRKALAEADLVLFLFNAEAGASGQELRFLESLAPRRVLLLVNKVDAGSKKPLLEAFPISARTGLGLDEVRQRLLRSLGLRPHHGAGDPVVFTRRQEHLLKAVAGGGPLEAAREALLRGPAEPYHRGP
jgi:tRNA modification GTPase